MEPAEDPVVYVIHTTISNMEQRWRRYHVSGMGKDAIFKTMPMGWWIHLDGSWEAVYLGEERPHFNTGDKVEIKIRKIEDAKPSQAPIEQVR